MEEFRTKTNFDVSCMFNGSVFKGLTLSLLIPPTLFLPFFLFDCGVFIFFDSFIVFINKQCGYITLTLFSNPAYICSALSKRVVEFLIELNINGERLTSPIIFLDVSVGKVHICLR